MGGEGGKSPELAIHTELLTLPLGANSHQKSALVWAKPTPILPTTIPRGIRSKL
jgi:hypothetical protein